MKTQFLSLICFLAILVESHAAIVITGFGSGDLNPLNTGTDFLSPWTGTQSAVSVSIASVPNDSGGIYSTLGTPVNISGFTSQLTLTGSLSGTPPTTNNFRITVYDDEFNTLSYNFAWTSFSGGPQTVTANQSSSSGIFDGTVASWGIDLFGSGDFVSFTFENMEAGASIPEPSTYVLLVGGLAGFWALRFRRA